jgi:hypothetical protein
MPNPKLKNHNLSLQDTAYEICSQPFPKLRFLQPESKGGPCCGEVPVSLGLKDFISPRFLIVYIQYCNFKAPSWWGVVLIPINWRATWGSKRSAWQYTCQNCHPKRVPLDYQKLQTRASADPSIVGVLLQRCHSECWCHNVDMAEEVIYYE